MGTSLVVEEPGNYADYCARLGTKAGASTTAQEQELFVVYRLESDPETKV